MEHVVFYPAPDGSPAFRRMDNLEAAVRLVEHLRNVDGVSEASVHSLTSVPLSFRAYYRVEVPGLPDSAPALVPVTETTLADRTGSAVATPGEDAEHPSDGAQVDPAPADPAPAEPVPADEQTRPEDVPAAEQDGPATPDPAQPVVVPEQATAEQQDVPAAETGLVAVGGPEVEVGSPASPFSSGRSLGFFA